MSMTEKLPNASPFTGNKKKRGGSEILLFLVPKDLWNLVAESYGTWKPTPA